MNKNGLDIVSSGMMRAQSISIQVSDRIICNAKCKYCISRTTPDSGSEHRLCEERALRVGLGLAERMGATHAILTGKADPAQEKRDYLYGLIRTAREYVPLADIHTNGYSLQRIMPDAPSLEGLVEAGLTMITFSIASFDTEKNKNLMKIGQHSQWLIGEARNLGLLVRCSVVMNMNGVADFDGLMEYISIAGNFGAHMVVVRELWTPDIYADHNKEVFEWNKENKIDIGPIEEQFMSVGSWKNKFGISQRDPLPWGTPVFAVGGAFENKSHGVNVTFARCDEATRGPVIKSIVHKPNGHGYRNWDHEGDILY